MSLFRIHVPKIQYIEYNIITLDTYEIPRIPQKVKKTYFHWSPQSDLAKDGGTQLGINLILDKHIQILQYSTNNCNLTKVKQVDCNYKV